MKTAITKHSRGHKILSAALAVITLLALLPALTFGAQAADPADSGSIGSVSDATLRSLGFALDPDMAKAFLADTKNKPTGDGPIVLRVVNELAVSSGGWMPVYDLPKGSVSDGKSTQKELSFATSAAVSPQGAQIRSVELDWTGSGKPDHIAQILAYRTTSSYSPKNRTSFELRLIDSKNNTLVWSAYLGEISFQTTDHALAALLAITAGDFNNDGKDEIAFYNPAINFVYIYTQDGKSAKLLSWQDLTLFSGINFHGAIGGEDGREFPSVSLAGVRQRGERDDLAIAVSCARFANARKGSANDINRRFDIAKLIIWKDPGSADDISGEKKESFDLRSYHGSDGYNFTLAGQYIAEMMMFPGVDAGDINGDGIAEIVVAGYRLVECNANLNADLDTSGTAWDLDRKRMLVNYYTYTPANAEKKTDSKFEQAGLMQWISTEAKDYGKVFSDTNRFDNGPGGSDKDYLIPPPAVKIFAERGNGYNKSVFVNGFVLALPTTGSGSDSQETSMGMYGGWDKNPSLLGKYTGGTEKTFRIRYAAPLGYVETPSNNLVSSINERAILEATAGNYDNNPSGKEQVVFTYLVKKDGSNQYSSIVCMLNHTGDPNNAVGNQTVSRYQDTTTKNITGGVILSAFRFNSDSSAKNAAITVCSPDSDDDSGYMQYNTKKSPEFYFTDPQIIAVMQAAPYFAALDKDYYDEPATSVTKSKGGGTTDTQAASITVGGAIGWHVEGSVGPVLAAMSVVEAEIMFGLSGSAGYELSHEKTATTTVSFNASYQDSVALTMSTYVRYYYNQWEPISQQWKEAFIDVPVTTATSQVSVNIYDRIAEQNGWMTLRDNILGGSQAGKPATYSSTIPHDSYTNTGSGFDFKDGVLVSLGKYDQNKSFMQTGKGDGSISASIALEEKYEHALTWGASFNIDAHARGAHVQAGFNFSADYTGGHGSVSFNGVEFAGTVPNIPEEYAGDYGFSWELGAWFRDITADGKNMPNCLIVGYRVKDVMTMPEPPLDLKVNNTTPNSVELTWSNNPQSKAEYYVISRVVDDDFYFPLATIDAGAGPYYYTDNNCDPGTTYKYAVRTFGFRSNLLKGSKWSDVVSAITPGEGLSITHPQDVSVRSGQNASFTAAVAGAVSTLYQWQVKTDGVWEDVKAQGTSSTLSLDNVTDLMSGNEYRCVIRAMIGNTIPKIYTNAATLTVGKTDTSTTLSLSDTSGEAQHYRTVWDDVPTTERVQLMAEFGGKKYYVMKLGDKYHLMEIAGGDVFNYITNASDNLAALAEAAETSGNREISLTAAPVRVIDTQYFVDAETGGAALFTTAILDYRVVALTPNPAYDPENPELGSEYLEDAAITFETGVETNNYRKYDGGTTVLYEVSASSGTRYYQFAGGVYTRVYLDSTVTHDAGGTDLPDFNWENASYVVVSVAGTAQRPRYEFVPGETVTLTAAVSSRQPGDSETPTGVVCFIFTPASGKTEGKIYAPLKNGTATVTWMPVYEGEVSIVAQYLGNNLFLPSTSAEQPFLAYADDSWLNLEGAASMVYGGSVDLNPTYYEVGAGGLEAPVSATVSYAVKNADDEDVTAAVMTGNVFKPALPGRYVISAQYTAVGGSTYTAAKAIIVSKKPLTVKAEDQKINIGENADGNAYGFAPGLVSGDSAAGLFKLEVALPSGVSNVTKLGAGSYTIRVAPVSGVAYTAFLTRYEVMLQSGVLTVDQTTRRTVTFNAGPNGSVSANLEGGMPIGSGNKVADGLTVEINAIPNSGYTVEGWTVTPSGGAYGATQSIQLPVTDDVTVNVTFKPVRYTLSYGAAGSGTLTAKLNSATGTPVSSGTTLTAQTAVFFEAVPADGYYIKSWTINGTVIKDGAANFTGATYTLAGMSRDTTALVEFAPVVYYNVKLAPMGLGAVTHDAAVNGDGKLQSGSTFTITAVPDADKGYQITEWRSYGADGTTYTVLQGNIGSYTVSALESDLDIRVVFETPLEYTVNFVADPAVGGSVAAASGGAALTDGGLYQAFIPIAFTAAPNAGYGVIGWTVNGELQDGEYGLSFTLDELSGDTVVTALLDAAEIIDLTELDLPAPVQGETPVTQLETEQYTGTVVWSPVPAGGVFDWDTEYTAEITLIAKPGYTLIGVTQDFFEVAEADSVTNAADSGVVTAVFPATDAGVPEITSADTANVTQGGTFAVTATGKPTIQFSLEGDIPGGVVIDSFSGELSVDSAVAAGRYTVTVKAENTAGSDTQEFTLTVTVKTTPSGGGGSTAYYTVTFNTNGGSAVASQTIASGGKVKKPADPTEDGYAFAGWYKDTVLTRAYDFDAAVTTDFTLYAKWTEAVDIEPDPEPKDWENPFIDVKENDWFYEDVGYVYGNGLMLGTAENRFSPQMSTTRGMIVTILYRMAGEPDVKGLINPFTDVAEGEYYTNAVKWGAANGIILGFGGGIYGPNYPITREQLAAIFYRYADFAGIKLPVTGIYTPFKDDAKIAAYAKEAVEAFFRAGIIGGKPGNIFDPQGEATRAEVAAMLHGFMDR